MQIDILGTESLGVRGLCCVVKLCQRPYIWAKGTKDISYNQACRAKALANSLGRTLRMAEGTSDELLTFSLPVPHGERGGRNGSVMMTRVKEDGEVFVHASDIQMLNDETYYMRVVFEIDPMKNVVDILLVAITK